MAKDLNKPTEGPGSRSPKTIKIEHGIGDSYKFYKSESRFYRKGSVDTIALLTNWGADYGYPDNSWMELSEETGANVIVSNRVGKERDMKFKGGSAVIDRNRKIYTFGSSFNESAVVGGVILL